MKFFNTAGPIRVEEHYNLSPLARINIDEILLLIKQKKYFVLHAPRQTGKTSSLFALRDYLNNQDEYYCIYSNFEDGQAYRNDIEKSSEVIIDRLLNEIRFNHSALYKKEYEKMKSIGSLLEEICVNSDKPVVFIIDEIDSLIGDSLISVLRQIRSRYTNRPEFFPQSIILCGVRDIRDYRITTSKNEIITGGSAFNIKAKSVTLGNFTIDDIKNLYEQHTKETGQKFNQDIYDYVWELTEGQPWLVNALAYSACFEIEKDSNKTITKEIITLAKEQMIIDRVTHLDQLSDKLKEERVRRVIEAILTGDETSEKILTDDIDYVIDLGLIKKREGTLDISNQIYREVIPRALTYAQQLLLTQEQKWYVENGKLNMEKMIKSFQEFWRENSEIWVEKFDYKEAAPQLILQAFLQRILNGGGRIHREYGLGKKRTDLLIEFNNEKFVIEIKIKRGPKYKEEGIKQTLEYLDKCDSDKGYLIIFDVSKNKNWNEKIYSEKFNNKLTIYGM